MDILQLLSLGRAKKASDLHISPGLPPFLRIDGQLQQLDSPTLSASDTQQLLDSAMTEQQRASLAEKYELDFSLVSKDLTRFRANVFHQQRGLAAAIRLIPETIPSLQQLEFVSIVEKICHYKNGLVLVTGPTGSGKSTTLAAMLEHINQNRSEHIITLEDPIEFIYQAKQALIQQRELHTHTHSFKNALRSALREDPDIILIGELRDLDTIRLALTAAETGHLVFASLHTMSAAKTLNRIVDVFPGAEKELVRGLLAETLHAIIAQDLLPKIDGGRIAAQEILICNAAIRNLIRENKPAQIYSQMQTSAKEGMQTMAMHVATLEQKKIIKLGDDFVPSYNSA